jgi:hypothetical protein
MWHCKRAEIAMVRPNPEPPRLFLLLAKNSPVAIVIARVRAKLFHVVKWQYVENVIEHGSWFKGSLYPDSSDISFDGRHMVYFALNPKSGAFSWTAVCEPPFLKALAFWEHESTWYGGGFFPDGRTLWLYMPPGAMPSNRMRNVPSRNVEKLYQFRFPDNIQTEKVPIEHRMARDGWVPVQYAEQDHLLERTSPDGKHRLQFSKNDPSNPKNARYRLFPAGDINANVGIVDVGVTWADWDVEGMLILARGGIVCRLDPGNPDKLVTSLDLSGIVAPENDELKDDGHVL